MNQKADGAHPTTTMMWAITDQVIENETVLDQQFFDLLRAGFGGVAAFIRCSRYTWDQPVAQQALARIRSLCQENGICFWAVPDPRFLARLLMEKFGGLPVLLYGDQVLAKQVPNVAPVQQNRFNIRCYIPPRHCHMVNEVAIDFTPAGIEKIYAVRKGRAAFGAADVLDATPAATFFYHAKEKYVEAFGQFEPPEGDWQIIAFFKFIARHVDYSNPSHMEYYIERLMHFARVVGPADLLMWDEPGYTCVYGALPFSDAIQAKCGEMTGQALSDNLWKIALDCEDQSHIPLRTAYFKIVQDTVVAAQKKSWEAVSEVWHQPSCGVHDTWHWEYGDMCDMNHGSLDLWQGLESKDGGFVDVGNINLLKEKDSFHYANVAAVCAINKSLGRFSQGKFAYNNLWTAGKDADWQVGVMDYCVNLMALLGLNWFAHIYGPVGTIGEEGSFLGDNPMPGYPHHSTWQWFPEWTQRLRQHAEAVGHRLPMANVLLVFPVESMQALANNRADALARDIFNLILNLMDEHYHVDIVSPTVFAAGGWDKDRFSVHGYDYEVVLLPHASVVPEPVAAILKHGADRTLYIFSRPTWTNRGVAVSLPVQHWAENQQQVLDWLCGWDGLRRVTAPENCWVSLTPLENGVMVTLMPSRFGSSYAGEVRCGGASLQISETSQLQRLFFPGLAAW
ncbi:MAG: hypothetical protein ACOY90_10865 [Candidatus Zhuqueibacterota bacterium]